MIKIGSHLREITKKNDDWYTPRYAVKPILNYIRDKSTILCPFDDKESEFVKVLKENNHTVVYSHIDDGKDFFTYTKEDMKNLNIDYIISNPPFSLKTTVFKKLYELEIPFAMLLNTQGIFDSKERFELFKENYLKVIYLYPRISYLSKIPSESCPPFQSAYVCSNDLFEGNNICFEYIDRKDI